MNSTNPVDDELSTTLAREAERFSATYGSDLSMDRVLLRAGEIRRGRRMRASIVMAAAIVAIAVPLGITLLGSSDPRTGTHPLGHPTQGVTTADHSALNLSGLGIGEAPRTGYVHDGKIYPAGLSVGLRDLSASPARLNGGYLFPSDRSTVSFLADDGTGPGLTWTIQGDFAVSSGGNVGAFVEQDGTVIAVQDAGSLNFTIGKVPTSNGGALSAVAVTGENCSGRSEADTCRVYVADNGQGKSWVLSPHHPATQVPDFLKVADVSSTGDIAGIRSTSATGSCSDVRTDTFAPIWTTCEQRFVAFSPAGDLVLGGPGYGDGLGDNTLYVMDASTGKVRLTLKVGTNSFIRAMQWEDDTHILANVYQDHRWAVLRIDLNGSREYALPAVAADDSNPPYVLATAN